MGHHGLVPEDEFYEDDEPIEKIRAIVAREPDGVTRERHAAQVGVVISGRSSAVHEVRALSAGITIHR